MAKKQISKKGGIYKIYFNQDTSNFYIGSAVCFSKRIYRHKNLLKKNTHPNTYLQRLCNKYKLENLIFEIIEVVEDVKSIIRREQFYIDNLNPKVNILKTAGSLLGYRHSKESRERISIMNTGRKMTEEQIKKGVFSRIGQRTSKGCKRSDEVKKHLSSLKKIKIQDTITGNTFNGVLEAANSLGLKYQTLYAKLSGRNFNNTSLKFI